MVFRGTCSPNNYNPNTCPILGRGTKYKYTCERCSLVKRRRELFSQGKSEREVDEILTSEHSRRMEIASHRRVL